jgi:aminopeptidase N/puromycin-sensitive aminopeptidase
MVESYLGEETFRQGVHNYLKAHMYGNATAEDFWNAQTANSHKPVDKIMASFIAEPGVPLLSFGKVANGEVPVSQSRFFLNPKNATEETKAQVWTVPICFKTEGTKRECELLTSKEGTLKVPNAAIFYADGGGAGYYRSAYTAEDYAALLSHVTTLTPVERVNVVGDELALMRSGKSKAGDFLSLAASLKNDDSSAVTDNVIGGIHTLWSRVAATEAERQQISTWVASTYGPRLASLGEPKDGETPEQQELRADLFGLVGGVGEDAKVIAESRQIAEQYLTDPGKVNATLGREALAVAAIHGDAAFFDLVQKTAETSKDPTLASEALYELAHFKDPELVRRALDYAASGKVRNQDATRLFAIALQSPNTQDTAWQYIEQNWPNVKAQFTTWAGGELVSSTAAFCTPERRDEVKDFFATHKVAASANALTRSQNSINDCVDLRAEQSGNLQQWLSSSASGQL